MKMDIVETSNLELDNNLIHPFVRVHIVNMQNGCYLKKKDISKQAVYMIETITVNNMKD